MNRNPLESAISGTDFDLLLFNSPLPTLPYPYLMSISNLQVNDIIVQTLLTFSHKKIPAKVYDNNDYYSGFYYFHHDGVALLSNLTDITLSLLFAKEQQVPASIIVGAVLPSPDKLSEALTTLSTMLDLFSKKIGTKSCAGLLVNASNSKVHNNHLTTVDENLQNKFEAVYVLNQEDLEDLKSLSVPDQYQLDEPLNDSIMNQSKLIKKGDIDWKRVQSHRLEKKSKYQQRELQENKKTILKEKVRFSEEKVRSLKQELEDYKLKEEMHEGHYY